MGKLKFLNLPGLELQHLSVEPVASRYTDYDTANLDNNNDNNKKLRGLSPRTNYTDRATAACRRI
jgi:hypothetical protein